MIKKIWIDVYTSPYVNMLDEDKLRNEIEPLPTLVMTHIGGSEYSLSELHSNIGNSICSITNNRIYHMYEGDYTIYIDLLVQDTVDIHLLGGLIKKIKGINEDFSHTEYIDKYRIYKLSPNKIEMQSYETPQYTEGIKVTSYLSNYELGAGYGELLQTIGIVMDVINSAGGLYQVSERIRYWHTKFNKEEYLFNEKIFYDSFYKMHRAKRKDSVMLGLGYRKSKNGFKITLRNGEYIFKIKTNPLSEIVDLKLEKKDKWRKYIDL